MMRSMNSAVSSLKNHQTRMDVIGNNIANVNTVGFKSSSTVFSDVFYQTTQSASGPNKESNMGGVNPKQIGLGANVSSISKSITDPGGSQTTNNALDCMLTGDSFFITKNGGRTYFTKNGAFKVDADGTLVNSEGAKVQGWQVDPDDPTKIKPGPVSNLNIMSPENQYTNPEATTAGYLSGNIDRTDTQLASGSAGRTFQMNFYDNLGYEYTAKFVIKRSTVSDNAYNIELKDILKDGKSIMYNAVKKDDGTTEYTATGWGATLSKDKTSLSDVSSVDSVDDGKPDFGDSGKFNMVFDGTTGKFKSLAEDGSPDFDASTMDDTVIKKMYLNIGGKTPNPFKNIELDFSQMTMFASQTSSKIESTMGDVDGNGKGKMKGTMKGVSVDNSGKIYGSYDNGDLKLLGQIAVAGFKNPAGLEAVGNSNFVETMNSGKFDGVGKDVTSDGGKIQTGMLEMSNVDLAAQFTDMITTQRGFQANSRTITTTDSILEELINLKR